MRGSSQPGGGSSPKGRTLRWGLILVLILAAVALAGASRRLESRAAGSSMVPRTPRFTAGAVRLSVLPEIQPRDLDRVTVPIESEFQSGQTLGEALEELDLDSQEAGAVIAEMARFTDLRKLRPTDRYGALLDTTNGVQEVRLTVAGEGQATVRRARAGWEGSWRPFERSTELRQVRGTLEGGILEASIRRAGGEAAVTYAMSDVLQWDLDFNRDLREGDRFEILYELELLDGEPHGLGDIQALVYENGGKMLEAYRFGEDGGYYDGAGRPLRKLFLRSPLKFSRVTSSFSRRRFHPILKSYRPHYGVDYGAPTGTPVRVTANGSVTFVGRDGGGGNTVKVRHPNGYVTAYLHLSRFAKGIGAGRRVQQGDTIGYVGSTGMSTAPHLDYRVRRDGRWINPLSLKSEPADPVPEDQMPEFLATRDRLRGLLRTGPDEVLGRPAVAVEVAAARAPAAAVSAGAR